MTDVILQEDDKCYWCNTELPKGSNAILDPADMVFCSISCAKKFREDYDEGLKEQSHPDQP